MSEPGRNDPCPCGSGKKYKRCCLTGDRERKREERAHPLLTPPAIAAARNADGWEIDIRPLPGFLEDDPAGRLGLLVVWAAGFVIHADTLSRPSAEVEPMTSLLVDGFLAAVKAVGAAPPVLETRDGATAELLGEQLDLAGFATGIVWGDTPGIHSFVTELASRSEGEFGPIGVSCPGAWSGWDLPVDWIREMFRASAAFHRSRVWRHLGENDFLGASLRAGEFWWVSVAGRSDGHPGLLVATELDDFFAVEDLGLETSTSLDGSLYSLGFDRGSEVDRVARREIGAAGWEVADPDAYPRLVAIGSPAGGIRRPHGDDLARLIAAVAALGDVPDVHGELEGGFVHEETGVELQLASDVLVGVGVGDTLLPDLDFDEWPGGRSVDEPVAPGGARGPSADLGAAGDLHGHDPDDLPSYDELLEAYEIELSDELAPATVDKHLRNVVDFLNYLRYGAVVPLTALHEADLRRFLYDVYPRKYDCPRTVAASMLGSLRRFFRFLDYGLELTLPWSKEILADREFFLRPWEADEGDPEWHRATLARAAAVAGHLESLLMEPDADRFGGEQWGPLMGWREASLQAELERRWLVWREELIAEGVVRHADLRAELLARQRRWERSPHPRLDGRSPVEVIAEEKEERRRRHDASGLHPP